MTSRFVSGGTIAGDGDGNGAGAGAGAPGLEPSSVEKSRDDGSEKTFVERARERERGAEGGVGTGLSNKTSVEWEAVQKDLEEERRKRAEARKLAVEGGAGGERSLYDILQANKGMYGLLFFHSSDYSLFPTQIYFVVWRAGSYTSCLALPM